ncbi:MAG TPA: DNA starvation/stationary phase protection protein [Candidatus Kapabacteria bacterium]|nr:DNA starvation/stationary phase protection protein [Candidatus Kapabacteria bacterium]
MKPNIEISDKNLKEIAKRLNTVLADEYVLYTKTRNAHWNIQGNNFMELHKFFEGQYEALDTIVDDTAERVRALGHFSAGSLKDFLSITHLSEQKHDFGNQKQMIQTLLDDHETIIRVLRNEITIIAEKFRDLGTSDFITGIMEQHEKMAWMLRAYIS